MPLDPRQLDLAADFCRVGGKGDLIEYLGLTAQSTAADVQEALRKRRKYMQGMQANPKYKNEAVLFIKNFAVFQSLLADPAEYLEHLKNKAERANLPVLEMSIKTALARGGDLSPEQVDFLKRNATQLGIGEETFVGTLHRLVKDAGGQLPTNSVAPPPPRVRTVTPTAVPEDEAEARPTDDPYVLLGARRDMPMADVRELYHDRLRRARTLPREQAEAVIGRLESAWAVLSARTTPSEVSRRTTGRPARERESSDQGRMGASPLAAPTAPPVRERTVSPRGAYGDDLAPDPNTSGSRPGVNLPGPAAEVVGEVEIRGATVREVRVDGAPITMPLYVMIHQGLSARVTTDVPWLTAQPNRIEASRDEQKVTVRIEPEGLPAGRGTGRVHVQNDRGERATVTIEVMQEAANAAWMYVAGGVVAVVAALGVVFAIALLASGA